MSKARLLLLSNSTNYGSGYLEHAMGDIADYLGDGGGTVAFVPYAGVTVGWDAYTEKVAGKYKEIGWKMESVHASSNPASVIEKADAIAVGGGNTFYLLKTMNEAGIMDPIRKRVRDGVPYMGWSAGSNMACPTIRTTNDMPIVEPASFDALGLVPFQINPHFTDAVLPNHNGETRTDRLREFIEANPGMYVVGLREGSILRVEGSELTLLGSKDAKIFRKGDEPREVAAGSDLQFLM